MGAVTIEQLRGETYTGGDSVVKGMYEDNRAFLDEILELARLQRLVPFVGAGFSQFHYRGWGSLLRGIADRYPDCQDELEGLLEKGEYEDAASLLQEEMGARGRGRRNVFLRAIGGEFGEKTVEDAFAEMSRERRGIPRVFRGPILTTNYDLLIERSYREAGEDIEVAYPHVAYHRPRIEELLRSTKPSLFKLHGDVKNPDKIVITREDYDEAYGADDGGSELTRFMGSVFEGRGAVLFLGCSLGSDRTMDVLDRSAPDHVYYALVGLPEGTENPGDPFSPNLVVGGKREPGYRKMDQRLAGMNVCPIWYPYGKHDALDALLGWLEGELDPASTAVSSVMIPDSTYGPPIGREREISEVVESLSREPSITMVTGLAGIGKTEVCREALRRLRDSGRTVVYAEAAGRESAWAQCDAVAEALRAPKVEQREGIGVADYARYLVDKLSALERPVVYLDNWEDAWLASDEEGKGELVDLLQTFRDVGASVFASSKVRPVKFATGAITIEISGLERRSSVDLFRKVFHMKAGSLDPSGPEFEELLNELEDYPLAIVLTATLAATMPSWADVRKMWVEASQKVSKNSRSNNSQHTSLATALRLSWDAVANVPLARVLWGVMALTPGNLPRPELDVLSELSGFDLRDWLKAYAHLNEASLISNEASPISVSEEDSLSMLRPVREAFFQLASDDLVDQCLNLLKRRLVGILEADITGSGFPETGGVRALALASLPRALFLLDRSLEHRGLGAGTPKLARALGNYYQFDWAASRPVLDALLRAARDAGDDGLEAFAAQTSAECAMLQDRLGDAGHLLEEAERLHREAGDALGTANDLQDRAELAMRLGDLDEAGHLLEEAERLHREAGDGIGTAYDLQDRAELAMLQGRLDDAGPLLEEAERLHREAGDALGTANDLQDRARLLALQGGYDRALSELAKAEELYEGMGDEYSLSLAHGLRDQIEQKIAAE